MSDMGEFWRDIREIQKMERAQRQERADEEVSRIRQELLSVGVSLHICSRHHWQFHRERGGLLGNYWPSTQKAQVAGGAVHHGVTLTQIVSWVKNRA